MNNSGITKMLPCPCCGNYTIIDDSIIVDICPVCFWQYDVVAQENPNKIIGPNHGVSFNTAKENYKKYGAISIDFVKYVRRPLDSELPTNNN